MIVGVIEHSKVNEQKAVETGFDFAEKKNQYVYLDNISEVEFSEKINEALEKSYPYIVINTCGNSSAEKLKKLIENATEQIKNAGIPICIENGMSGSNEKGYAYNDFSEVRDIKEVVAYGNQITESELFGICINIGYSNLLAKDTRKQLEEAGDLLALVHINDNDGFKNDKQMPYTFTKGRGEVTTEWPRIIGALIKLNFDGYMVFDVDGLFNRTPEIIIDNMLNMLVNIAQYWLLIITLEDLLNCGRKIILFGAGRMASNYLYIWGDKYAPVFIADNNENRWNTLHRGILVKSPESIYDIPEEERLVLICSQNHEGIGVQLRQMGIPYFVYDDNYYDFVL